MNNKLWIEYKIHGNETAREKLITDNMNIAYKISYLYHMDIDSREDMQQEALIGLMQAVDKFDHTRGLQFSTFAWTVINNAIKQWLRREKKMTGPWCPYHINDELEINRILATVPFHLALRLL